MGYCASVKQVLGPPFDKMSHTVTARQVCQIPSLLETDSLLRYQLRSPVEYRLMQSCGRISGLGSLVGVRR